MLERVERAIESYLATNLPYEGKTPEYGIRVTAFSPKTGVIDLTFTFKEGNAYCCTEPHCHFGPYWDRLRHLLAQQGLVLNKGPLSVRFTGVVEHDDPAFRRKYEVFMSENDDPQV